MGRWQLSRNLFAVVCLCAVTGDVRAADAPDVEQVIAPLLARRCLGCHAGDAPSGQLDLTTRALALKGGEGGPALDADQPSRSALWERIAADEMPPKHPLDDREKQLFQDWLAAGGVWPKDRIDRLRYSSDERAGYDWWSFQPLQPQAPPMVVGTNHPVDAFVVRGRTAAGLSGSAEADRRILIRRLSFDLLGLPPSPEDVRRFVADSSPTAWEDQIERYLASPHYGERWARHWLDIVRFGESNGFERDLPRDHAWHYRDWVVEALNRDLPYDEFVRWQLAADSLAPDNSDSLKALGFLVAGPHDTVIPVSDRMRQTMRQDEMEDLIGVVGQTFLGLTVNCARCHDHKFDPISSREYYQLAAALSGVDHGEVTITPEPARVQLARWQARRDELSALLKSQADPVQKRLLKERQGADDPTSVILPTPLARWDFTKGLQDQIGALQALPAGTIKVTEAGIELEGKSYLSTPPIPRALTEKTLEVRLRLNTLDQRGGGAISLQTTDGRYFDAVVFGEQQPGRWMSGSDNFSRTQSFDGPAEESAHQEFVTITNVYRADGTILAYRNGQPYGRSYVSKGPFRFEAGQAQILFGLRHSPSGGNRLLAATFAAAAIYDRALNDAEVATSARHSGMTITEADITAALPSDARQQRQQWQRELGTINEQHAELTKSAPYKVYTAALHLPPPVRLLRRGNVADPGDEMTSAGLSAIRGPNPEFGLRPDAIEHHRRAKLAEWMTSRENPLFPRVMVNRLWQYHFGKGLVETPNDFGFHAGRPSHPELLDWLSAEFVRNGYSLKQMHRLLLTSATYRQASTHRTDAAAIDADNRWLWRMSPRRLDAESVRDAILVSADELNPAIGGKGYLDFHSYFFKGTQFYDPVATTTFAQQRRTLYRMWARSGRSPFLDTFDCPDPSTTTPKRASTTTPLQALSLLNNAFVITMADRLAARLVREAGSNGDAQIDLAYDILFSRQPTPAERSLSRNFLARHGLPATCRGWLNASELVWIE